jgi:transcriptional regulator NrdR family protein
MVCPHCGTADTRVVETRTERKGLMIRRRHECGNAHRFNSYQIHDSTARSIGLAQIRSRLERAAAGIAARAVAFRRQVRARRLLADGMTVAQVAQQLDITAARVRQIRQAAAAEL